MPGQYNRAHAQHRTCRDFDFARHAPARTGPLRAAPAQPTDPSGRAWTWQRALPLRRPMLLIPTVRVTFRLRAPEATAVARSPGDSRLNAPAPMTKSGRRNLERHHHNASPGDLRVPLFGERSPYQRPVESPDQPGRPFVFHNVRSKRRQARSLGYSGRAPWDRVPHRLLRFEEVQRSPHGVGVYAPRVRSVKRQVSGYVSAARRGRLPRRAG